MIEYTKYRYQLWMLQRSKKKLRRDLKGYIEEAKNKDERNSREAELSHYLQEEDENIRELHAIYLRNIAKNLMVPSPNSKDETYWDRDGYSQILTEKGIYELKKSIRLEKKERRDVIFAWVVIITGLIGALIGLVSVIKK